MKWKHLQRLKNFLWSAYFINICLQLKIWPYQSLLKQLYQLLLLLVITFVSDNHFFHSREFILKPKFIWSSRLAQWKILPLGTFLYRNLSDCGVLVQSQPLAVFRSVEEIETFQRNSGNILSKNSFVVQAQEKIGFLNPALRLLFRYLKAAFISQIYFLL